MRGTSRAPMPFVVVVIVVVVVMVAVLLKIVSKRIKKVKKKNTHLRIKTQTCVSSPNAVCHRRGIDGCSTHSLLLRIVNEGKKG